mmetsp:Transcript_1434/g.2745  ORF Transcript_1434/g.2745 Transcript_1434/m.2745 type:complete len:228 (-) Transcript_1434:203-886(-)
MNQKKDENKNAEEFSGGGKSSHTAVMRNPGGNPNRMVVTVTLYNNGFMVSGDEKGFRDAKEPENRKIIDDLKKTKQVPPALRAIIEQIVKGQQKEVGVEVKDKSSENYYPPKPTFKAFQGQGFSMKSESSAQPSNTNVSSATPKKVQVDAGKPSSRILLVLHPRKRAPQAFNLDHTAMDIYQHVLSLTPDFGPFDLVSGFPPKSILKEPSKTIEELKLQGATITQRK